MSLFLLKKKHEYIVKNTDNGEVKQSVMTVEVLGLPVYRSVTSHKKEKAESAENCINAFQKFKEKSYADYMKNQMVTD